MDTKITNNYEGKNIRCVQLGSKYDASVINNAIAVGGAKLLQIVESQNIAIFDVPSSYDKVMEKFYEERRKRYENKNK